MEEKRMEIRKQMMIEETMVKLPLIAEKEAGQEAIPHQRENKGRNQPIQIQNTMKNTGKDHHQRETTQIDIIYLSSCCE